MSKVLVHGPGLGLGLRNRNAALGGVLEEIIAASETLIKDREAPWSDDLDIGLEGIEGKFKANLVVTLPGAAVGDGKTTFLLSNGDLGTSNDRAGKRGTWL